MAKAVRRIRARSEGLEAIAKISESPDRVVVIHYSCESFYDQTDGRSARITSIAVRNLGSGQTTSFSIHQMAERDGHSPAQIEARYDDLERRMLDEFYEYVARHSTHVWLHWNMRDINYGFSALAHRHRVLGGKPLEIHESQLMDLARVLVAVYGVSYIGHPRLTNLIRRNSITDLHFLSGSEEATAFKNKEYVKLHQSTLRKVDIIANVLGRAADRSLKTDARWVELYGAYPAALGEFVKDHWFFALLGLIATIAGLVTLF